MFFGHIKEQKSNTLTHTHRRARNLFHNRTKNRTRSARLKNSFRFDDVPTQRKHVLSRRNFTTFCLHHGISRMCIWCSSKNWLFWIIKNMFSQLSLSHSRLLLESVDVSRSLCFVDDSQLLTMDAFSAYNVSLDVFTSFKSDKKQRM